EEIFHKLKNIIEPFDLFVSTPFEGHVTGVLDRFGPLAESVTAYYCENRGRDVAPFLQFILHENFSIYSAVLKLHSKKSTYSSHGAAWRSQLYDALCGSSLQVRQSVDLILSRNAGMVGPARFFLTH